MRHAILYFAMAVAFTGLSAAPASAQYLPDLDFPDAPLSLGQEEVVARIREEIGRSFTILRLRAKIYGDKPLSEWTQRDYANFRNVYDAALLNRAANLSREAGNSLFIERGLFFQHTFEGTGGGGDGEGDD